ncbi:DUF1772 domain-containing protein [Actinomadura barringtoniae]|uniref:DUF1772 domain-containing protein n=1 Tax=Actinomadura barringtoniae TaxID=1427535 RepID=A0A939PBK4_9ACTN|nr:anthrone oxygenase family protein [Actinomadura barringtoniae]MBO2449192.1 DUF1772 domain-containing protein [Actinomadura barringtoniae]
MFSDIVLIAATVLTGLVSGVFALYAHTIMPGLKKTDDRTFVGAFQALDRAIINPWFMVTFLGPVFLIGVAGVMHLGSDERARLGWLIAAFVLYLLTVILTIAVNVPMNDALKAAGDPAQIDVAKARADFNEAKWVAWNHVRTVASSVAFVILTGVLLAA